jgi:hypothetical protein
MNRTLITIAATAALLVPTASRAAASGAAVTFRPSAFALPLPDLSDVPPTEEPIWTAGQPAPTRYEAVRYRPRSRYRRSGPGPGLGTLSQIHIGFFDPEGDVDNGFVGGLRGGPLLDPHVQVGVGVDWVHRSDNQSTLVGTTAGPGGTVITTQRELARSSSNLFPLMGFVQFQADENLPFIPYFGAGGGYEVLFLSADDYVTGASFDATYGGWGWQAWGGAAIPLSGRSRLSGEIFLNECEVHRDVDDPSVGGTVREIVKQNGVGVRVGMTWGF